MKKLLLFFLFSYSLLAQTSYNLSLYTGDYTAFQFHVKENLSTYKLHFVVKANRNIYSDRLIEKKNSVYGGSDSEIKFETYQTNRYRAWVYLQGTDTDTLEAEYYYYDLVKIDPTDSTIQTTIFTGSIQFKHQVQSPYDNTYADERAVFRVEAGTIDKELIKWNSSTLKWEASGDTASSGAGTLSDSVVYTSELTPYASKTANQTFTGQNTFSNNKTVFGTTASDSVGVRGNLDVDNGADIYNFFEGGLSPDKITQVNIIDTVLIKVTRDALAPNEDNISFIKVNDKEIYLTSTRGNGGQVVQAEIQILGDNDDKIILDADSVGVRGGLNVLGNSTFAGNKNFRVGNNTVETNSYLSFTPGFSGFYLYNTSMMLMPPLNTVTSDNKNIFTAADYYLPISSPNSIYSFGGFATDGRIEMNNIFLNPDTSILRTIEGYDDTLKINGLVYINGNLYSAGGSVENADSLGGVPASSYVTKAGIDGWSTNLYTSSADEMRLGKSYNNKRFNNGAYSDVWNIDYVVPPYNLDASWLFPIEHRTDYYNDTLNTIAGVANLLNIDGTGTPIWNAIKPTITGEENQMNIGDLPDSVGLTWANNYLTGNKVILSEANKTAGATRFPMPVKGFEFKFGSTPYYTYPYVYGFYSDLTTNTPSLETAYHFYGKGDYPSYFGGDIITDGTIIVNGDTVLTTANLNDLSSSDYYSGEANIPETDDSVMVTHGAVATPQIQDISITPTSTNFGYSYWVEDSSITSTTFKIKMSHTGLETRDAPTTFSWQIGKAAQYYNGTATIISGNYYVDVPHGQLTEPNVDDISISPQSDTKGYSWWIDEAGITATTIRIRVGTIGLETRTSDIKFSYQIKE